jgi:hypothetical protein
MGNYSKEFKRIQKNSKEFKIHIHPKEDVAQLISRRGKGRMGEEERKTRTAGQEQ